MKIYLNADGRGAGGPQRWAARFIAELRSRGYEVTNDIDSRFDAAYLSIGAAHTERLLARKIPFVYRAAGCAIPEWFDAMGKEMTDEHRRQNDATRRALESAPRVIYQSEWAKAQLDRLLFKRDAAYAVINNGVCPRQYHPGQVENADPVLVSGGNLRYRFRLTTLFEVSRNLNTPHLLLIAGPLDDESREALDIFMKDSDINERTRYLGNVTENEWAAILRRCDILFHPVCGDACPNVVVEALMSGVPTVAPRFGGASELIGEGGIAFECKPWNYASSEFIQNAVSGCEKIISRLGYYKETARKHAESFLTLERMTDRYLDELNLPMRIRARARLSKRIRDKVFRLKVIRKRSAAGCLGFSFADLAFGGAQVFYVDLIERLAQKGHRIRYHLFASEAHPTLCDARLYSRINRFAEKAPLDEILHCGVIHLDGYHNPKQKEPFLPIWEKCIETYHSEYSFQMSSPNHAPHRVVISSSLRKALSIDCELVYYGINTDLFKHNGEPKEYDVGILGRIHQAKNHLLFLDICRLLASERPLKAVIIGGYPWNNDYTKAVKEKILQLKGHAKITVTGFVENEEVASWLNRTRILLVTSPSEGFGRMAAEALACEVPVVANPTGGLVEIVNPGVNGFLPKYDDAEDFARVTSVLLADDRLREQMGRQGRKDVLEKFSVDKMVTSYERIYETVRLSTQQKKVRH